MSSSRSVGMVSLGLTWADCGLLEPSPSCTWCSVLLVLTCPLSDLHLTNSQVCQHFQAPGVSEGSILLPRYRGLGSFVLSVSLWTTSVYRPGINGFPRLSVIGGLSLVLWYVGTWGVLDFWYQCYQSTMFTLSIGSMPSSVACRIYGVAIIGTRAHNCNMVRQANVRHTGCYVLLLADYGTIMKWTVTWSRWLIHAYLWWRHDDWNQILVVVVLGSLLSPSIVAISCGWPVVLYKVYL